MEHINVEFGAEVTALQTLLDTQPLCDNEQLMQALEIAKRALALRFDAMRDLRWLVVRCHLVNQCVARLITSDSSNHHSTTRATLHQTDDTTAAASGSAAAASCYRRSAFLLENAIASALGLLQQQRPHPQLTTAHATLSNNTADHQASTTVSQSFDQLFVRILTALDATHHEQQRVVAASVLSRMALLLAVCWLQTDRRSALSNVTQLLTIAAAHCAAQHNTTHAATSLLLLRGVLALIELHDAPQALHFLKRAAATTSDRRSTQTAGVVHFWLAIALLQTSQPRAAVEQLQQCLPCDFAAVASLNLIAHTHIVQMGDAFAATQALQRALELDALATASLFNYALLLQEVRHSSTDAQQQLLELCFEAAMQQQTIDDSTDRKRARSGSRKAALSSTTDERDAAPLVVTQKQLAALLSVKATHTTDAMLATELAYAALANGDYRQSKRSFDDLFALESCAATDQRLDLQRDYVFVLLQSRLHTLALDTCDRVLASTQTTAASSIDDISTTTALLHIQLYRADALLSLERVSECAQYLQHVVAPQLTQALERLHESTPHDSLVAELTACHTQLLNNLAVATACRTSNGNEAAIAMLRAGVQQYPTALRLKFNLVLLLWRTQQREAACAIWFDARHWHLRMDAHDMRDDRNAIAMVAAAEDAALAAAGSLDPHVSDHVQCEMAVDDDDDGGISKQQLLYVDALVLNHWGKIQSSRAIETSVRYIEYLDTLVHDQDQQ